MVPAQLVEEVEDLRRDGYVVGLLEAEGWAHVVLQNHVLPPGYNKRDTELLLKFPLSYPNGRPDMFWTEAGLLLADGRSPRDADLLETALGKKWRRFSWHPQAWNPGIDNLRTYLEFVNSRLAKVT